MFSAMFFSLGLVVSQMTISSKIYGFLNVKGISDGTWLVDTCLTIIFSFVIILSHHLILYRDPTLACVMGGGLVVSFASYQFVKGFNVFKVSPQAPELYPFRHNSQLLI